MAMDHADTWADRLQACYTGVVHDVLRARDGAASPTLRGTVQSRLV